MDIEQKIAKEIVNSRKMKNFRWYFLFCFLFVGLLWLSMAYKYYNRFLTNLSPSDFSLQDFKKIEEGNYSQEEFIKLIEQRISVVESKNDLNLSEFKLFLMCLGSGLFFSAFAIVEFRFQSMRYLLWIAYENLNNKISANQKMQATQKAE